MIYCPLGQYIFSYKKYLNVRTCTERKYYVQKGNDQIQKKDGGSPGGGYALFKLSGPGLCGRRPGWGVGVPCRGRRADRWACFRR